jgi:hypothetical protein
MRSIVATWQWLVLSIQGVRAAGETASTQAVRASQSWSETGDAHTKLKHVTLISKEK